MWVKNKFQSPGYFRDTLQTSANFVYDDDDSTDVWSEEETKVKSEKVVPEGTMIAKTAVNKLPWFRTHDIVELMGDRKIRVIGRSGEIVKLSQGEFVRSVC